MGGYSISLDGSSIDSFRPDYSTEAIEEIKKELRIKGYKVEQVKDIYGIPYYSRLRIEWR